ncbi:hypothetical protein AB0I91_10705 [Actinosynnema sp. NPDC049800]
MIVAADVCRCHPNRSTSDTRQFTQNMFAGTCAANPDAAAIDGTNAVPNETD